MDKYCRLTQGQNNVKYVAETFDFNPFEWIPNDVFLQDCMECPDYIDGSYAYKDGKFIQRDLIIEPSVEDRVFNLEAENTKLKAELEVTQAVVDELLFGGVTA